MKDNPNFVNIWAQIILMIVGFALVAYLVMSNTQKLLNNEPQSLPSVNKITFNNYYQLPLPLGISGPVVENKFYSIDKEYQTIYLIKYINQEIKNNRIDTISPNEFNNYEIDEAIINQAAEQFFAINASSLNLDYEPNERFFIIPQREFNNVVYDLTDINQNDQEYILVYDEIKTAYLDGDPTKRSVTITTARYKFYIIPSGTNYQIKGYRYEKRSTPPVGYQIAS